MEGNTQDRMSVLIQLHLSSQDSAEQASDYPATLADFVQSSKASLLDLVKGLENALTSSEDALRIKGDLKTCLLIP